MNCPSGLRFDLSAPFAPVSLPQRLRRLADIAEADALDVDAYGKQAALQFFEAEVAKFLAKEAGRFFATGTLAQRAAIHAHFQEAERSSGRCGRLILHPSSHLIHHDCLRDGALQSKRAQLEIDRLPAFNVLVVGQFERPFRSEDFQPGCPRAGDVVVIEIPHRMNGGRCISWAELSKIAHLVKAAGARLHMDGARLSEALPFYSALQVQREELCGLFDSIYLSWYKGFGGMSGATLSSSCSHIALASDWQVRLGGSAFTHAPHWIDAREQFRTLSGSFEQRYAKLHQLVEAISSHAMISRILRFEPPTPQSCMIHVYLKGAQEVLTAAHDRVQESCGLKLWNHLRGSGYPVQSVGCNEGEAARESVETALESGAETAPEFYFEFNMGPANAQIPLSIYLEGWTAIAAILEKKPS